MNNGIIMNGINFYRANWFYMPQAKGRYCLHTGIQNPGQVSNEIW